MVSFCKPSNIVSFPEWLKAYVAVAIDTDGYVTIEKSKDYHFFGLRCRVGVTNTHRGFLEFLKEKTGGGGIYLSRPKNKRYKNVYVWTIGANKEIYDLLSQIIPYMIIKKEKAIKALKLMEKKIDYGELKKRERDGLFHCPKCGEYLSKSAFWKNKAQKIGIGTYCKKCRKKMRKERND